MRVHKTILALPLMGYCVGASANKSKDDLSLIGLNFNKYKSLVDIRQEWINKIYPEKDVFQRINKSK